MLSVVLAVRVAGGLRGELTYGWLPAGDGALSVGLLVDPLSAYLAATVSVVGFLVTVYAAGYMGGSPAAARFFGFFSFFLAAMLGLVLAADFLLLLVCWELVGAMSYALIGFYWRRPDVPPAANKAFLMTRTMDLGLYLAAFIVFTGTGTLSLNTANAAAGDSFQGPALVAAAVLLLVAALGKSAQLPTVTWLPAAMVGPTPVSALIHSATMVAAGVYLITRTLPMFEAANVLWLVGAVGALTALASGLSAVWQTDLKRLLAASTSSQLGFMFLALGAGAPFAALFHLATHAVFKSLMFLGAGNIQEKAGTTDLRRMGGLRRPMPRTFVTFLVGALSLAAVPPLAGFFSKEIMLAAALDENLWLYIPGLLATLVTAVYTLRAILLPFFGPQTTDGVEEAPRLMLAPAWVLAALTIVSGFFSGALASFLGLGGHTISWRAIIAVGAVAVGFAGGWTLWRSGRLLRPRRYGLGALGRPAGGFFGLDAAIDTIVVRPVFTVAAFLAAFDEKVVDAGVELVGRGGVAAARLQGAFDTRGVDGVVREVGALLVGGGGVLRKIQTGAIEHYLLIGLLSLAGLVVVLGIASY